MNVTVRIVLWRREIVVFTITITIIIIIIVIVVIIIIIIIYAILYTTPLSHLIESSSVQHHLYADDTQLFITFSPAFFSTLIVHLLSVLN